MSMMVGMGRGAQMGSLSRNAEALERLERVDTIVIDKTGTLTAGKPKVAALVTVPGIAEADLLRAAASLERASEHPLAAALLAEAEVRKLSLAQPSDVESPAGKGVTGMIEGKRVAIGNAAYLQSLGVDTSALAGEAERLRGDGATVVSVAFDAKLAGVIAIPGPINPSTPQALQALRDQGIEIVMLTGDNKTTAPAVARQLCRPSVHALGPTAP